MKFGCDIEVRLPIEFVLPFLAVLVTRIPSFSVEFGTHSGWRRIRFRFFSEQAASDVLSDWLAVVGSVSAKGTVSIRERGEDGE